MNIHNSAYQSYPDKDLEKNKAEVDKYGRDALEKNINEALSKLK